MFNYLAVFQHQFLQQCSSSRLKAGWSSGGKGVLRPSKWFWVRNPGSGFRGMNQKRFYAAIFMHAGNVYICSVWHTGFKCMQKSWGKLHALRRPSQVIKEKSVSLSLMAPIALLKVSSLLIGGQGFRLGSPLRLSLGPRAIQRKWTWLDRVWLPCSSTPKDRPRIGCRLEPRTFLSWELKHPYLWFSLPSSLPI